MSYLHSVPFSFCVETLADELLPLAADLKARLKALPDLKNWQKRHDLHLLLILKNLLLAYQLHSETYVAYSRNKNDYSLPSSRTPDFKVAYKTTIRIIDGLHFLGLLEGVKGIYYDDVNDPVNPLLAFRARMRAAGDLLSAFSSSEGLTLHATDQDRELIILRDHKGNSIDVIKDDVTSRMRTNISKINEVNRCHFIAFCVLDVEFEKICRRMTGDRYGGQAAVDMFFGKSDIYRVFNGTLNEGGRFYGGWWENLPKEYRKFIRIDGLSIVELDFSCLHPTLLYLEDHLPVPGGDMYEVPGFPPEARKFLKVSMNIILNAKSNTSAKKAIRLEQRKNPDFPPMPEGMTLDQLFEGFLEKHEPIRKHFFTLAGRKLQRIDSDIAEAVMLLLVERDIPVLPLHDSFLVSRVHADDLAATMDNVVSERYGRQIKIKADDTAWNFIYDIGLEDEYDYDIERYEQEALRNPNFKIYNAQWERFDTAGDK